MLLFHITKITAKFLSSILNGASMVVMMVLKYGLEGRKVK